MRTDAFFKAVKKWLDLLEKEVRIKIPFQESKQKIFIQLLNVLIFDRILEQLGFIKDHSLRRQWDNCEALSFGHDKKKFILHFFCSHTHIHTFIVPRITLFHNSFLEKIVDDNKNFEGLYECLKRIIANIYSSENSLWEGNYLPFTFAEEDIFGKIYEQSIADEKKKEGIFYTPKFLRKVLIENTLVKKLLTLQDEILSLLQLHSSDFTKYHSNKMKKLIDYLISIKIVDPACGSGSFLIDIIPIIWNTYGKLITQIDAILTRIREDRAKEPLKGEKSLKYLTCIKSRDLLIPNQRNRIIIIILRHIYGKERDEVALQLTKINIWLTALKLVSEAFNASEIKNKRRFITFLPELETNIVKGNALIGVNYSEFLEFKGKKINFFYNTQDTIIFNLPCFF